MDLLATFCNVRYMIFLDIVDKNGIRLIYNPSIQSSTFCCLATNSFGMATVSLTTGAGFFLVVLPLRLATSFPNIFWEIVISSRVTGQLRIAFVWTIILRSWIVGHPNVCNNCLARLARSNCHCVKNLALSSTVSRKLAFAAELDAAD